MKKYNPQQIEKKWQKFWAENQTFVAKDKSDKPKKYVLIEFPYPSGEGLHMGHLRPYVAGDVYARHNRLRGFETMYPMGWDAFGLPAENFALKKGVHPSITTAENIANAKRQVNSWGIGFDWSREVNTTDPSYYKWTQWIFLQFYKTGLAYEATGLINWCPKDKTGLANEEVIDGKCERCGSIVEKKEMKQWYLKITAYAEKLLEGLKTLDKWPEPVKLQQENWIGKSTGAEIEFPLNVKYNYVILHGHTSNAEANFYPWLKTELEKRGHKVQVPTIPVELHDYPLKRLDYVMKNVAFDKDTVIIGHSLGAVVGMKVVEQLDYPISGLITVAGFVEPKFKDIERAFAANFDWQFDWEKIKANTTFVEVISDLNDIAVPVEQGKILAEKLNGELIEVVASSPHFGGEQEPTVLQRALADVTVFTTRPDTIFGATYLVLAPEHQLIQTLQSRVENLDEVIAYIDQAQKKTDIDRSSEGKEKTGVELKGVKAINPATKEEIPAWVADYVLGSYGTGAIMAVPAHDERDFEFAKKYHLIIRKVILPPSSLPEEMIKPGGEGSISSPAFIDEQCWVGPGKLINSGKFDGLTSDEAITKMAAEFGKPTVQYKLRDWVFSRQRYWGEPIPIIHCEQCGTVPVPEDQLPVELPNVRKYEPTGTGESPLAAISDWVNVKCPNCGGQAKRETNTMPQWAGSSWYYLRYTDPQDGKEFAGQDLMKYWLPVDVYFGGMEHTTLHLLYSRFWNLFLHDQGLAPVAEPYVSRVPHGIVLAADGEKMSKSRGNVVNPDDIVKTFGADTLRMYELFLGPHELTVSWNDKGIIGVKRFLDRVWTWVHNYKEGDQNSQTVDRELNKLIKKVSADIEAYRFNTAISAFMQFHNEVKDQVISKQGLITFLRLLYPFAPHISEELHEVLGGKGSMQNSAWPEFDASKIASDTAQVIVQINGKVKDKLSVPLDVTEDELKKQVLALEKVQAVLAGAEPKKIIVVPGRLVNLVM
jgi:leucyl-tRNA synthetase